MQKPTFWFVLIFSLIFLFYNALVFFDADFGWHLKFGEAILNSGIPKSDPFSYTMPSYSPIEHEWLIDIFYAKTYPVIGEYGLAFLFAAAGLTSIWLALKNLPKTDIFILLLILAVSSFQPFFTISPKVVSWLLFALINLLVFNRRLLLKCWFLPPLVILLWVNIHGSFVLGIITILISIVADIFKFKKVEFNTVLIVLASLLVTLINPYGGKIWNYVFATLLNNSLRSFITEWRPAYVALTQFSFLTFLLAALFAVIVYRYRSKLDTGRIFLSLMLFVLTFFTVRYLHYWILSALPLIYMGLQLFRNEISKNKISLLRFKNSVLALTLTGFIFISYQLVGIYNSAKTNMGDNFYPINAVNFLTNNMPSGNIFADYKWGGYLVWKLNKKVFINGMMPVWENKNAPANESTNAFKDYLALTGGNTDYKKEFKKYKIDTVLADNNPSALKSYLVADGWNLVYSDKTALIYRKQ